MIDETTGREFVEVDGQRLEITAYLSGVVKTQNHRDPFREILSGFIAKTDEWIHTSYIVREVAPDVFLTRSGSLYRVESWAPQPAQD
jgi:hypothetical protein